MKELDLLSCRWRKNGRNDRSLLPSGQLYRDWVICIQSHDIFGLVCLFILIAFESFSNLLHFRILWFSIFEWQMLQFSKFDLVILKYTQKPRWWNQLNVNNSSLELEAIYFTEVLQRLKSDGMIVWSRNENVWLPWHWLHWGDFGCLILKMMYHFFLVAYFPDEDVALVGWSDEILILARDKEIGDEVLISG